MPKKRKGPMDHTDILAALTAQAVEKGVDPLTVRAIVEEAAEEGARRALGQLGLQDGSAHKDIVELRQLLISWRDVQSTARRTVVGWLTTLALGLIALGLTLHSDLH